MKNISLCDNKTQD